jgi:quercetin dioxygenase-like cupin family protein
MTADDAKKEVKRVRAQVLEQAANFTIRGQGQPDWKTFPVVSNRWEPVCEGMRLILCSLSSQTNELTVMNAVMDPGSKMGAHEHDRTETVFVVFGSLLETVSGRVLNEGDSLRIAPNQLHGWHTPGGCLATVSWKPPFGLQGAGPSAV